MVDNTPEKTTFHLSEITLSPATTTEIEEWNHTWPQKTIEEITNNYEIINNQKASQ